MLQIFVSGRLLMEDQGYPTCFLLSLAHEIIDVMTQVLLLNGHFSEHFPSSWQAQVTRYRRAEEALQCIRNTNKHKQTPNYSTYLVVLEGNTVLDRCKALEVPTLLLVETISNDLSHIQAFKISAVQETYHWCTKIHDQLISSSCDVWKQNQTTHQNTSDSLLRQQNKAYRRWPEGCPDADSWTQEAS